MKTPVEIRGRAARTLSLLLPMLLLVAVAAQPFVADGGFDRPRVVAEVERPPAIAVASGDAGALIYWLDRDGVWAREASVGSAAERLVAARGVRHLAAVGVAGDSALAWVVRDLTDGRTGHWLSWRGEERLLFEALQPYDVQLVAAPDGPAALVARREGQETVLRMLTWDGRDLPLVRSEQSLVRYDAAFAPDGSGYLMWLEGYTDRNAVGVAASDWTAYLAEVDTDGTPSEVSELGPARFRGVESQTALGIHENAVHALWPGPDGEVLHATASEQPRVLGIGFPVAVEEGAAYWADGASLRRQELGGKGAPQNVAWSPVTIERAELLRWQGVTYLAWSGPGTGGGHVIAASDDRQALTPDWRDRMAAAMGWNPWGFWEALAGQVLGALFAGVLTTLTLTPLLWAGAVAAARRGWARDQSLAGVGLGAVVVLLLLALAASRSHLQPEIHAQLFGSLPELLISLLVAAALTWWLRRRADSEQLIGVLGSACLFTFLCVSTLAFLTFQAWVDVWSYVT